MTLAVRVIPCLDVKGGRVVKGLRFESLRDAGDPVEAAVRYEEEGADELTFLDITAANEERGTLVHVVERVAEVLSIPFTVGGGVRSVEDAGALLSAGADRVVVNTAAVADPSLVTRLAEKFGAQCVVVAVDAKRFDGRMRVMTHGGRTASERFVESWIADVTQRGAGEILLTSVDADGTQTGFDLEMLKLARSSTGLPLVASGGAGKVEHFASAVREAHADAVLAASVFHDRIFSISEVKRSMAVWGVSVRGEKVVFDENGLVPVIVRDARSAQVLTLAYANEKALAWTRETGFSHFYSRSRRELWKKGATSGHVQRIVGLSLDCDGDAVIYDVVPAGPACHTGAFSCFAGVRSPETLDLTPLFDVVAARKARPEPGSYTNALLDKGILKIAKKVGEEGVETALAAVAEDADAVASEAADLLYHLVVLLSARGVAPAAVQKKLEERQGKRRAS